MIDEETPAFDEWHAASQNLRDAHDRMFKAIGPVIKEALERAPDLATKLTFLHGMINASPNYWMAGIQQSINESMLDELRNIAYVMQWEKHQASKTL